MLVTYRFAKVQTNFDFHNPNRMEASPLQTLPPELRNNIYEQVLVNEDIVALYRAESEFTHIMGAESGNEESSHHLILFKGDHPYPVALCFTCRQIQKEALPLFFAQNTFEVRLDYAQFFPSRLTV